MSSIKVPESNFMTIKNISDILPFIKDKPEIKVKDSGLGTVSVIYKNFDENTFDKAIIRESRGMTFDKETGKIIGRPLHKFFNMGERTDTEVSNVDFSKIIAIWDKIDGSMISAHRVGDDVRFKTQKNFTTSESMKANKFAHANQNIMNFCDKLVDQFTPVFEFKDPENVIVVPYDEQELVFLHLRHIETGAYIPYNDPDLKSLLDEHNIPYLAPKVFPQNDGIVDIHHVMEELKTIEGIEGYVFQFKGGEMIKAKSHWYNAQHRAEAGLRARDVAYMFLDGTIDDVKGSLKTDGYNIQPILAIETTILNDINKIEKTVKKVLSANAGLTIGEFAQKINKDPNLKVIKAPLIAEFKEMDFDYNVYYRKQVVENENKFGLTYLKFDNVNESKSGFIRSTNPTKHKM